METMKAARDCHQEIYRKPMLLAASVASIAIVLSSSLERIYVQLGPASLYWPQAISLTLLPICMWNYFPVGRTRLALASGVTITLILALPTLWLPQADVRSFVALQYAGNATVLLVTFALIQHLDRKQLERVVGSACYLFAAALAIQIAVAPSLNKKGTDTFGIPRPALFFTEDSWCAMYCALLCTAALALRRYRASIPLVFFVLILQNRGAIMILLAAIAFCLPFFWRPVPRRIAIGVPAIVAGWLIYSGLTGTQWIFDDNTIGTRTSDIAAALRANPNGLLPWGGDVISVYDSTRSRQIPGTSTTWLFDSIWKFGIPGALIVVVWIFLLARIMPRWVSRMSGGREYWIVSGTIAVTMSVYQFNNASGRVWTWALFGLILGILSQCENNSGNFMKSTRREESGRGVQEARLI